MKNILIPGGAGFIGSHLCDYLLSLDCHITVIDNLSLGKIENIQHLLNSERFHFVRADLTDMDSTHEIFSNNSFDTIFHLAANSDIARSHNEPGIDLNNTFLSTYNLLTLMKEFHVNEIVFSSSSAVYGDNSINLSEDSGPLMPVSHYGASKLASEAFISSFAENYNMKAWIVRFPNVVGSRATHGVIHDFIKKLRKDPAKLEILGNGEQNKPYMHVKDLIEAIWFVFNNSKSTVNTFNLGVESRTKVKDIARFIIREMNLNPELHFSTGDRGWIGDVPEFSYNLSKIHQLGWKAKLSSDEAVKLAINQILEDPL